MTIDLSTLYQVDDSGHLFIVVQRLRERRPGALFNDVLAEHLLSLPLPAISQAR